MAQKPPTFSKAIGIAITTHNRSKELGILLESIRRNTSRRFPIAVFDDGTTSHPNDEIRRLSDFYLQACSSGIAENKNRALYFFSEIRPVRRILLLEDDLKITSPNWLNKWKKAVDFLGHVNITFPSWSKNDESFKGGKGKPRKPHRWTKVTGQVTGADMMIMRQKIGYMNPMFSGFGHEHLEWTERWISEGFGGKQRKDRRIYFSLDSEGIGLQWCPSTGRGLDATKNRGLHIQLRKRGHPKCPTPWLNHTEREKFISAFGNLQEYST